MALAALEELAQSYSDLKWHLDPVAATRAGLSHYDDRFGRFAAEALRPHIAALKALTAALEELEPEALDDEIDRTALLNEVRVLLYRCERGRVFARDPAQWVRRVIDGAVAGRLGDLPAFLEDARSAVTEPVGLLAASAAELLPDAAAAVRQAALGTAVPAEAAKPALAALAAFGADLERWAREGRGRLGVGEDAFNFHLHYEHALRDTAPELWRYAHRLVEELEQGTHPVDVEPFPELLPPVRPSLVRQLVRAPVTIDGWALCRAPHPERVLRHAVGALLDIGLHTRDMGVDQCLGLIERHLHLDRDSALVLVRHTAAAPTYALSAAVGRRELLALRAAYQGPDFGAAVRPFGALPVTLIRWGLGLGE